MFAHLGPNLQFPCIAKTMVSRDREGRREAQKGRGYDIAHLCKVFADSLGGGTEVMAKRTGIARLAGALTKELAWNMRGI